MFKYFGIPDIHHRIFDDKNSCKYCCCNYDNCNAPVYYQGPDGPTRLVKWFVRSEETPEGDLIVDEIPFSVKSFGNSVPSNYYITQFISEIELPKSFRKNLIQKINTEVLLARKHENKFTGRCFHKNLLSEN